MKPNRSILIAMALAAVSFAQAGVPQGGALIDSDQTFIAKAMKGGMGEIELGKVALRIGPTRGVRAAGDMLVEDHMKANRELMHFAKQYGVAMPTSIPGDDWVTMQSLRAESGQNFKTDFIKIMLQDHIDAIGIFETEARDGKDPALRAWAEQTVPVLRRHLKMIEDLQRA